MRRLFNPFIFSDEQVLNSLQNLGNAVNTINTKLDQAKTPQGPSAAEVAIAQQVAAQEQALKAQAV